MAFQNFFILFNLHFFFKVLQENVPQDTSWPLYPENNDVLQGLSPQNCFLCPLLYTPHVPDPGPHKCSHKLCVTLTFHNVFFFLFYWNRVVLQCCINFRCKMNQLHITIYPFFLFSHIGCYRTQSRFPCAIQ